MDPETTIWVAGHVFVALAFMLKSINWLVAVAVSVCVVWSVWRDHARIAALEARQEERE